MLIVSRAAHETTGNNTADEAQDEAVCHHFVALSCHSSAAANFLVVFFVVVFFVSFQSLFILFTDECLALFCCSEHNSRPYISVVSFG